MIIFFISTTISFVMMILCISSSRREAMYELLKTNRTIEQAAGKTKNSSIFAVESIKEH